MAFGMGSLGAMSGSPELARFLNQQQQGVGWDGARIVAMGTEAADDPGDPEGVAWQALQAVLILAGSPTALVRPMVTGSQYSASCVDRGLPPEPWRPIHVHPNDFEQIQRRAVNHTWCNLARVVADESEGWRSLLDVGASPGLGDRVYQIERSARGAKRSLDGHAPTDERTDWLVQEVLPELRKTARVLLLHGFGRGKGWERSDIRPVRTFLGLRSRKSRPSSGLKTCGSTGVEGTMCGGARSATTPWCGPVPWGGRGAPRTSTPCERR